MNLLELLAIKAEVTCEKEYSIATKSLQQRKPADEKPGMSGQLLRGKAIKMF